MLYEMNNEKDQRYIQQFGKAYGIVLLKKWLPDISKTKNLFVLDSYEEFKKIEDKLPEVFSCRADAKTGEKATLGVEGCFATKEQVENYISRVKKSNPNGVVLCIDTEEGTHERIRTDGAFNVYLQMYDKIYIDYLGKGFDMGSITKGRENHESWTIDWKDALFVTPHNMNLYRHHLISNEQYIESARRRVQQLINIGYSADDIRGNIPRQYSQMPESIKELLLDQIVLPLYSNKEKLVQEGLKSFGVQGMIIDGRLFPIEVNRKERFAEKSYFTTKEDGR